MDARKLPDMVVVSVWAARGSEVRHFSLQNVMPAFNRSHPARVVCSYMAKKTYASAFR
jgi:hypothetical protein